MTRASRTFGVKPLGANAANGSSVSHQSINQLFSWVNCDLAWECISELDQLVYVYDVEEHHILRGNSQCLFMLHEYAPTKSYRIDVFRGLFEPLEKAA